MLGLGGGAVCVCVGEGGSIGASGCLTTVERVKKKQRVSDCVSQRSAPSLSGFSAAAHTRCTHELFPRPPRRPSPLRHVWEKSGGAIDVNASPRLRLDPDGTLHISQTWSGDIGTYTCRVTSVGGNDSRSAHLRVRSAIVPPPPASPSILLSRLPPPLPHRQLPHAPENPVALLSTTEKRAINLTWAQAFDGNSPLIRYILEVSENSERHQKVPASLCRVPL